LSKKPKSHIRAVPKPFYSKTPWAGFARGCAPRAEALPVCADARCRRAKLCHAAHAGLFCQRTHFSPAEKKKFDAPAQRAFDEKFPAHPKNAPLDLREERVMAILEQRTLEAQEMQARWKAGEFDGLYGRYKAAGLLLKPPPKIYVEKP
jgi:hypothetical protein